MQYTIFLGVLALLFGYCTPAHSQSINAPLDRTYYHWVDRYEIKSGRPSPFFFSVGKPYQRKAIANFADSVAQYITGLSAVDAFNLDYLRNDNWEWASSPKNTSEKPIFKRLYRKKSDFYHVQTEDFELHLNPVIHFSIGRDTEADESRPYINTRGLQLRGMVGKRLGFYSFIGENQARFPSYVRDRVRDKQVVPQEGFWKNFKEDGVDFFTARGYISFQAIKDIMQVQFGHDRFFMGNGYRSMILSGTAPAYLFLKLDTKVWKLNYTNLFTQLTADVSSFAGGTLSDGSYPKKYMALHQLSVNISDNLNIGLFESIIFGADSTTLGQFDPNYLNPVIFYRALEQQNGSVDNALVGLDFKWNFLRQFSLYGQLTIDEFLLGELRAGNGWWGNKFGVQLGGKYIDALGIKNLDLQAETNIARPYTYSHSSAYGNYSHFEQPLAHPLGANFNEFIGIVRYQPLKRLNITGKLLLVDQGLDTLGVNWGGDVLKNNTTRQRMNFVELDRGNFIGQGISSQLRSLSLGLSYQWRHNMFIDVQHLMRRRSSALPEKEQDTAYTSLHLRWNIPERNHNF